MKAMLRLLMAALFLPVPSAAQVRVVVEAVTPASASAAAGARAQPLTLSVPSLSATGMLSAAPSVSAPLLSPAVPVAAASPAPAAAFAAAAPALAAAAPAAASVPVSPPSAPSAAAPAAAPERLAGLSALTADFTAHPPKSEGDALSAGRGLENAMTGAASIPSEGGEDSSVAAAAVPLSAPRRLLAHFADGGREMKSLFQGDAEIRPFVRTHKGQFWAGTAVLVSNAVVGVFMAKWLGHFTDLAVAGHHVTGAGAAMILATTAVLSLKVGEILLNWSNLYIKKVTADIVSDVRIHMARQLSSLSMSYYNKNSAQAVAPRVVDDVNQLITRNWNIPIQMPYVLVRGALSLAMLAVLDWRWRRRLTRSAESPPTSGKSSSASPRLGKKKKPT
jgi:hypothetical protein